MHLKQQSALRLRSAPCSRHVFYPLNRKYEGQFACAVGRYPQDIYDGVGLSKAHPWFLWYVFPPAAITNLFLIAIAAVLHMPSFCTEPHQIYPIPTSPYLISHDHSTNPWPAPHFHLCQNPSNNLPMRIQQSFVVSKPERTTLSRSSEIGKVQTGACQSSSLEKTEDLKEPNI